MMPSPCRRFLSLALTLSLASACAPADDHADRPIAMTLAYHIGEADGEPEVAFGQVHTILPVPVDGFYTCDRNDMRIRRYDESGRFVRHVGRRGAGPGEYGYCIDLALLRDTSLAVSDPQNGRIVVFDARGESTKVIHAIIGGGLGGTGTFFVDTADRIWKKAWMASEGVSESDIPAQFVILDRDGTRLDSVRVPSPGGSDGGYPITVCASDSCYSSQPVDTIFALDRDGTIALASPRRYSVLVRRADGQELTIGRDIAAVPYGEEERAMWASWHEYQASRSPEAQWAPISAEKPFLRDLRFDDVGRLWAQVHGVADKREVPPLKAGEAPRPRLYWQERNTFDLFSRAGEYLGRLALEPRTKLMASRGDRVWLLEEGESGEQLIGVYDLKFDAR